MQLELSHLHTVTTAADTYELWNCFSIFCIFSLSVTTLFSLQMMGPNGLKVLLPAVKGLQFLEEVEMWSVFFTLSPTPFSS